MSLFSFLKRKFIDEEIASAEEVQEETIVRKNQLEFVDASKLIFASLPILLAKDVPVNSRQTVEDVGQKFTFPLCPGMFDYSKLGYIMTAWTDFHFKSNKAGCVAIAGGGKKKSQFQQPVPMDSSIVSGIFKLQDNIPLRSFNLNSPWKVFSYDQDISAILLPAWYHSPIEFLDNFYVYPGIVDYNTFHVCNVILSPKRKVEYTIRAGDPLLHIIPIYNKNISCGYGPPTVEQESLVAYDPAYHQTQYYRKNHSMKKSFSLEANKE